MISASDSKASLGTKIMIDYLKLYDLESYLFNKVNQSFMTDHFLNAFDFFCIIIWKANRSKSKMALKLIANDSQRRTDLNIIVKDITQSIFEASNDKERMKILIVNWKFRLPMATAILAVLYPSSYTIYDARVCEQLNNYSTLKTKADFDELYKGYLEFKQVVINEAQQILSLRDKDRFLFGKSFSEQLENDIQSNFQ